MGLRVPRSPTGKAHRIVIFATIAMLLLPIFSALGVQVARAMSAPQPPLSTIQSPLAPTDGQPAKTDTNDFYYKWSAVPGVSHYEFQSSTVDSVTNGELDSGIWKNWEDYADPEQRLLTEPKIHSVGAPDGTYYWQVRTVGAAGERGPWSRVWTTVISTPKLQLGVVSSPQHIEIGGPVTIKGTATLDVTRVKLAVNDGPEQVVDVVDGAWRYAFTPTSIGNYAVKFAAINAAGMQSVPDLSKSDVVVNFKVIEPAAPVNNETPDEQIGAPVKVIDGEVPLGELLITPVAEDQLLQTPEVANILSMTPTTYGNTDTASAAVASVGPSENGEVLGTEDTPKQIVTLPTVEAATAGWNILGVAWYWWLLGMSAVAGLGWLSVAFLRGSGGSEPSFLG